MKKRGEKAGRGPGTLVHLGEPKQGSTLVDIVEFDHEHLETRQTPSPTECLVRKPAPTVTWINVDGVSEVEVLQHIGGCFGIHPLVLEDILATDQRPKAEDYGDYLYVVLKMLSTHSAAAEVVTEQVSFILGDSFVISFQEGLRGDVFEPVRGRLHNEKGRLRLAGADYLLYTLLDVVVDNYFLVLERLAEQIELIEDELIESPRPATVQAIYHLKREMLFMHKAVWPLREVVGALQRRDSQLIEDATVMYLRDLYDHTVQVVDTLETLRDMLSGMLDIYLSSLSNQMNSVMKTLTVIATIFMPLSFIAGWYGMNFKYLPEYEWRYGYPAVAFLVLCVVVGMLVYFRKKRWM